MSATVSAADASARSLSHLVASMTLDDLTWDRCVYLLDGASIVETVAALKEDGDFLNPMVEHGQLWAQRNGKRVMLAHYETDSVDGWLSDAEVSEVIAMYDDETEESVTV